MVFQWLFSIGEHSMNYQVLKMKFKGSDGRQVVLTGVNTYPKKLLSSHNLRSILKHEDIKWVIECVISSQGSTINISQYPEDIKILLKKYEKIFGNLPPGRTPDRGV